MPFTIFDPAPYSRAHEPVIRALLAYAVVIGALALYLFSRL